MTEMNELTRSLVRVEELINGKQYPGALNLLWIAQGHALSAVKLIKDQAALLTKQQLEIITLIKDVEIQKERADMQYKRAHLAEAEIKELDEQAPVARVVATSDGFNIAIEQHDAEGINAMSHGDLVYARPAPAKHVPDGFVLVPLEPTKEMCDAYCEHSIVPVGNLSRYGYKVMIAAAKGE